MKRLSALLVIAALSGGCPKPQKSSAGPSAKQVEELGKRVDSLDARLAKIETLLAGALDEPAEPDPAAVYAVPIDGDPYVGAEHARITLIEGFEFA